MKLNSVLWFVSSVLAANAIEEPQNKPVAPERRASLIVEVDSGGIVVNTNATGKLLGAVRRPEHSLGFSQEGRDLTVRSPLDDRLGAPSKAELQSDTTYVFSVPAECDLQLRNSNNDVFVNNVSGTVKITSKGGGFQFAHRRESREGETAGGGIQVCACEGDLRLQSDRGAITVAGGSGSLRAETSGFIGVADFRGNVQVESAGSVMRLGRIMGKIEATNAHGPIFAVLPSPLPDEVRLSGSGGALKLSIPANAAFNLDVDTSGAVFKNDFTLAATKAEGSHITGTVNGGGKSVVVRTGGGFFHLEKMAR